MTKPVFDEQWRKKTDHSKVLRVQWINSNDVVGFNAPWFKRPNTTLILSKFLKLYERS